MKYLFFIPIAVCGAVKASAQNLPSKDSVQILSVIIDWNRAWRTKDYVLAARAYSQDARFTNAFGDTRYGQGAVQDLFKQVFSLPFVMAGSSETIDHNYQALSNGEVIVYTSVARRGQQMPDGSIMADRQTTHMRVFQKYDSGWKIKGHLISDARDKQTPKH